MRKEQLSLYWFMKSLFHCRTALFTVTLVGTALHFGAHGSRAAQNSGVPNANPRNVTVGDTLSTDDVIAPGFSLRLVAEGTDPIENPSGPITRFGYLNDGILTPPLPPIQNPGVATKTEPDENTYVVLDQNPGGPIAGYDYGRHFLFQGHENANDLAYVTRINLDVTDPAHRITLLTPVGDDNKTHFTRIDGSVYNPHTRTLLFTQENGAAGGVIELGINWPVGVRTLYGVLGQGGYEGIHPDDRGNILIIEDVGGTGVNIDPANSSSPKAARNPNSFVYRFVPDNTADLSAGGKLQALQVWIDDAALRFVPVNTEHPTGDVFSDNQLKLHTVGSSWPCRWVTVHDTDLDGFAAFSSNQKAKDAGATPFKRPENVQFLPGSGFNTFFFDPTGDTDARAGNVPALAARGAWGSIFRVDFGGNGEGVISIVVLGDADHAAFDNLAFSGNSVLLAAEDRGDNLHKQLNKLDSIWAFDVRNPGAPAIRLLALGRDPQSAIDAAYLDAAIVGSTFQNEGDNEPTGIHVSDGATSVQQMLGKPLNPNRTRVFFTQQHGMNQVFEITAP